MAPYSNTSPESLCPAHPQSLESSFTALVTLHPSRGQPSQETIFLSAKGRRVGPSTSGPLGLTLNRAHSSARGQPQSGLTLLRVSLRIRLSRPRIQQLFQLQSQGLRLRHGHQVTVGAALVNPKPKPRPDAPGSGASARFHSATTGGDLTEAAFRIPVGHFREARA